MAGLSQAPCRQDGRAEGTWTFKHWLLALVACCVPLDLLFWIARFKAVPFSLFCHWQVSSCASLARASQPSHSFLFHSPLTKVKRGRHQRMPEIGPLGSIVPVCHVIKPNPPFCPSWQNREINSDGNYNWRGGGCWPWDQWYRFWKGGKGGGAQAHLPYGHA